MVRKRTDTPNPTDIITNALRTLAEIEDERSALNERRKGALAPLFDELSLSKKAVAAFIQRRRMTEEDRANFDRTFNQLCVADGQPFQPDLFDQLAQRDMTETPRDGARPN